jgi:hypothetical protein
MRAFSLVGLLGFAVTLGLAAPAFSDASPETTEAAHKVLVVSFSPESYQKISESVAAQLPPEARADVAILLPTYKEMEDMQMALLVKYFTAAELKDMTKFYASSAGKKAIKVMPQIANDAQTFLMERVKKEMPTLVAKVKARVAANGTSTTTPAQGASPAPAAATPSP